MTDLQAVLWDMDGTLVDTEPYWIAAEYQLVETFNGSWNDDHAKALVGNPLLVSAAYLRDIGGVALPLEVIVDRLLAHVIAAAKVAPSWRPGVLRLLAELKAADVPCAMVTMSYRNLARAIAVQLPAGTFRTLVTGDELAAGKPHPEAYLTAAARLGVAPQRCIAIEDSPTGLGSAEAAGCVVVAVPNQVPIAASPRRTIIADLDSVSIAQLSALVAAARRAEEPNPIGAGRSARPR